MLSQREPGFKKTKNQKPKQTGKKSRQQNRDSVTGSGRPTSLRGLCSAPLLVSFKGKMRLFYSLKNGDKALAPFAPPVFPVFPVFPGLPVFPVFPVFPGLPVSLFWIRHCYD